MRIRDVIAETEVGVVGMLALKTEGGHEPRSVGSFWKLERQGNGFFPGASGKNTVLDFHFVRLISDVT